MVCIYCGHSTQVVNSRARKTQNHIWRRRKCSHCLNIFTTLEHVDYSGSVIIKRASGDLQPFSRDKLFTSIYKSCGHRENAIYDTTALTDTVMSIVLRTLKDGQINETDLVEHVLDVLKRFDKVAEVQYKAYHNS